MTGVVQNGSLPIRAILLTATLAPGIALLARRGAAGPRWFTLPPTCPSPALIVGAVLGAAVVRHRLAAVVFLGVVGYGMTGLFVIEGAPDLALTQVTVETLSTVLFVLVLRVLPPSDRHEPWGALSGSSSPGWGAWCSPSPSLPPATAPHLRCRRR